MVEVSIKIVYGTDGSKPVVLLNAEGEIRSESDAELLSAVAKKARDIATGQIKELNIITSSGADGK